MSLDRNPAETGFLNRLERARRGPALAFTPVPTHALAMDDPLGVVTTTLPPPHRHYSATPIEVCVPARDMSLIFTVVLDAAGFAAALGPVTARPGGPKIRLLVANARGRALTAELRPKQILRALALIAQHGPDNVGLRLEGWRAPGNVMRGPVLRALVNPAPKPKPTPLPSAKPPKKVDAATRQQMADILLSLYEETE